MLPRLEHPLNAQQESCFLFLSGNLSDHDYYSNQVNKMLKTPANSSKANHRHQKTAYFKVNHQVGRKSFSISNLIQKKKSVYLKKDSEKNKVAHRHLLALNFFVF